MSGSGGTQDWFYHAPGRRKEDKSPVDYPAPSQIPLGNELVDDRDEDSGMKRGWIRDTDSKYVKLAKMGGRKDLLRFREPRTTPTEAKPYPRVEWFDHAEDEPTENAGPREIFLPEYMVHEEHNPGGNEYTASQGPPKRPPYSLQDKLTAFQRDGDSVCDKTAKLPEVQAFQKKPPPGSKKKEQLLKAAIKQQAGQKKASGSSNSSDPARYPTVDMTPPPDKANISKLLSMGYQIDWYEQREKYDEENKKFQAKQPKWEATKQSPKPTTEYRDYINKQDIPREVKSGDIRTKRKQTEQRTSGERRGSTGSTKELFKLSKFGKASPKVDTHWTQSYGQDTQRLPVDTYMQQVEMEQSQ